ncbi:nuclear transport factor 2 family protein [Nonomuraea jiangxiensis]|uniref:DUF4440 domain-containing protein n=1 Tax=Nonomuraea jiangxiensis TaxID=633440 RepID=A0A1G9PVH4_9ACTN|nr:nuclear transport factor 2 family protein [Nonomuraea jiangxiensis]SDM02491.1 protein of unknown function [Nonomuraea jiangxiensis]
MKSVTRTAVAAASACALLLVGTAANAGASPGGKPTDEQSVIDFEHRFADWVVAGDVDAVDRVLAPDFQMTHGDQWTNGGTPSAVDDRQTFLGRVAGKSYGCFEFDNVKTEMHGKVAITYGRYLGTVPMWAGTPRAFFSVWYERVYQKHGNSWTYLSHRTVKGAHYGATAAEALDGMGPANPSLTCA